MVFSKRLIIVALELNAEFNVEGAKESVFV